MHPSASLHAILGDVLGTFGSSDLVDVGLPTGTAGIYKGDLVKVVHSSASLCVILGDVLVTFGSSDLVDVGLPMRTKSWKRMFNSFALKSL